MFKVLMASVLTVFFAISLSANELAAPDASASKGCRISPLKAVATASIFLTESSGPISAAGVFQGCWSYFPTGPCRAIYSDNRGYTICGECDASGNPGSGSCAKISSATLNRGYWCS